MLNVPVYISVVFGFTTFLAVLLFYLAANRSRAALIIMLGWLVVQTPVAWSGFYARTDVMPPRCVLLFWPPVILILALFFSQRGRAYLDGLNLKMLTLLHSIRILTALVFYWLYLSKAIPLLLTFAGLNFDVLVGLTAPMIVYLGWGRGKIGARTLRFWNVVGLGLLINLVIDAILSAPFPFQKFAFDQPDIAFLYFPFVWMSGGVAPLLLLAHLAALRQLQPKPQLSTETTNQTTRINTNNT